MWCDSRRRQGPFSMCDRRTVKHQLPLSHSPLLHLSPLHPAPLFVCMSVSVCLCTRVATATRWRRPLPVQGMTLIATTAAAAASAAHLAATRQAQRTWLGYPAAPTVQTTTPPATLAPAMAPDQALALVPALARAVPDAMPTIPCQMAMLQCVSSRRHCCVMPRPMCSPRQSPYPMAMAISRTFR